MLKQTLRFCLFTSAINFVQRLRLQASFFESMFEGWRGLSHPLPNLKSKLSMITFQFHKMCEAITRGVNRSFYINHQRLHLHSTLPHPTLWTRNTVHHKHLHLPLLQVMEYNSPPLPTLQVTEYNML